MKNHHFILLTLAVCACGGEKLLKVPRIYNAFITSEEELIPSQAYPAVAPVLRPAAPGLYLPAAQALPLAAFSNNKPADPRIPDVPPPPPAKSPPKETQRY